MSGPPAAVSDQPSPELGLAVKVIYRVVAYGIWLKFNSTSTATEPSLNYHRRTLMWFHSDDVEQDWRPIRSCMVH